MQRLDLDQVREGVIQGENDFDDIEDFYLPATLQDPKKQKLITLPGKNLNVF